MKPRPILRLVPSPPLEGLTSGELLAVLERPGDRTIALRCEVPPPYLVVIASSANRTRARDLSELGLDE
jgi:hypothetical protein